MTEKYNHLSLEKKWQKVWEKGRPWAVTETKTAKKFYVLDMFPYPSAEGLHVGHPEGYTASDIVSRFLRLKGYNVLHPMGWDAFGLPAENYAIKTGAPPREITEKNIKNFKRQIQSLGFSYDWSREINTTDPEYYKWTQWIFLQMFKKGLAFEAVVPINWCPSCKTGLANEEVVGGKCDRCGTPVIKKDVRQWMLRITKYADRLLKGLDNLDWPEPIKLLQKNWIGRSEGALIRFSVIASPSAAEGEAIRRSRPERMRRIPSLFIDETLHFVQGGASHRIASSSSTPRNDKGDAIEVFTTRADTLFGATYLVLAPEHTLVQSSLGALKNRTAVEKYIQAAKSKSDLERTALEKDKTGVELKGVTAVNPATGKKIPIWVSDYVLVSYGTGAIMAVPGHDERDFAFAKKYNLPIEFVIAPQVVDVGNPPQPGKPTVERQTIQAIVYNPRTKLYLTLKWKEHPWQTFVVGGVKEGEDIVKAARREIREETGYGDLKLERVMGGPVLAEYFAAHKKGENRRAWATPILFYLKSDKRLAVSVEEKRKHEVEWRPLKKITERTMRCAELPFWLARLGGEDVYVGEGVMVNSEKYNGLTSKEGGQKIIGWLEKNGLGKKSVNYKLRDWVFSRQRYWGEPIPLVHCDHCKKNIIETKHYLNFYAQDMWGLLKSGVKTVETRALNPDEQNRFFGRIKSGDYIKCVNKIDNETLFVEVVESKTFRSLGEFFEASEITQGVRGTAFNTFEELRSFYQQLAPDYEKKIEKNGLIAWRIKVLAPGVVPVPEDKLPVKLPEVKKYEPTGTGQSPLAAIEDWVKVKCPKCKGEARRETNTMPQWAGSCWYYLRYLDPANKKELVGRAKEKYWMSPSVPLRGTTEDRGGVDLYVGGAEHAVLHLLYARFWHMFLYDLGVVSTPEPFKKLKNQGMILGEDGQKMSKSRGNVINPDDIIREFGADSMRLYEMFMGPFEDVKPWSTQGIRGVYRFLQKVWSLQEKVKEVSATKPIERLRHRLIKKITQDIETFNFNTAVSTFMETVNEISKNEVIPKIFWRTFLILLKPFTPHLAEELWERLGHKKNMTVERWPSFNEELIYEETVEIIVQVNGKLRDRIKISRDSSEQEVKKAALTSEKIKKYVSTDPKKVIFVKNRLINFVV